MNIGIAAADTLDTVDTMAPSDALGTRSNQGVNTVNCV